MKFWINLLIYGTEEGPHMWLKRLPSLLGFFILFLYIYLPLIIFKCVNKKNLTLCQNKQKIKIHFLNFYRVKYFS